MNYGEDAAYWFLRLNGFFPITNFVVHASGTTAYTTECDVLAVRLPYVFEEIGGRPDDWDPFLSTALDFTRPIGLVCEVKTGNYKVRELFRERTLAYSMPRFGFVPQEAATPVWRQLRDTGSVELDNGIQIALLLIARELEDGPFLGYRLTQVFDFLKDRVARYPIEKYRDRMYFGSVQFQTLIELQRLEANLGEDDFT